jgi:ADP-heptose:LPS heptosyltransferase
MHVAAALETPTVTIFGHTNRYAHKPYQKHSYIVYNEKLQCSPCVDIDPYGACKDRQCLNGIEVEDVLTVLWKVINGAAKEARHCTDYNRFSATGVFDASEEPV